MKWPRRKPASDSSTQDPSMSPTTKTRPTRPRPSRTRSSGKKSKKPKTIPEQCFLCGRARAGPEDKFASVHVVLKPSRRTLLAFLSSHEFIGHGTAELYDDAWPCRECVDLIKKADKLHVLFEKSLADLKERFGDRLGTVKVEGAGQTLIEGDVAPPNKNLIFPDVVMKPSDEDIVLPDPESQLKMEVPDESFSVESEEIPVNGSQQVDVSTLSSQNENVPPRSEDGGDQSAFESSVETGSENGGGAEVGRTEDGKEKRGKGFRKCLVCKEIFPFTCNTERKRYHRHIKRHQRHGDKLPERKPVIKRVKCDQCEYICKRPYDLARHFNSEHPNVNPFPCDKCGERFRKRPDVTAHKASVHPRLICDCCGRKYASVASLHHHQGRYDYSGVCDTCGKFVHNVKQHKLKIHVNVLPTPCRICGFMCNNVRQRRVHEHEAHGKGKNPNDKKRWECEQEGCETWYTEKHSLARHMLTAHGVKVPDVEPMTCEHCGKEFFNPKSHKEHVNGHLGIKPHVCPLCPYATNISSNLHLHLKKIHQTTLAETKDVLFKIGKKEIGAPPDPHKLTRSLNRNFRFRQASKEAVDDKKE